MAARHDGIDDLTALAGLPDGTFDSALDAFVALQVKRVRRMYNRPRAVFAEQIVAALLPGSRVMTNPSTAWDIEWRTARGATPLRLQVKCSGEYLPRMGATYRSPAVWSFPPCKNGFGCDGRPLGPGHHCDVVVLARHCGTDITAGWTFFVLPICAATRTDKVRPDHLLAMGALSCDPSALADTIRRAAAESQPIHARRGRPSGR